MMGAAAERSQLDAELSTTRLQLGEAKSLLDDLRPQLSRARVELGEAIAAAGSEQASGV